MRQYLETHKIEDVFVVLTEKILTVQPTNPIGYIVGELLEKYPEQTKGGSHTSLGAPHTSLFVYASSKCSKGGSRGRALRLRFGCCCCVGLR